MTNENEHNFYYVLNRILDVFSYTFNRFDRDRTKRTVIRCITVVLCVAMMCFTYTVNAGEPYNRVAFKHWVDIDGNGESERTDAIHRAKISVDKILDCYSGQLVSIDFVQADHVVPLSWAWKAGADEWTDDQRRAFANDRDNLIAVSGSVNKSKGGRPPWVWMPKNTNCWNEYLTKWVFITKKYGLKTPWRGTRKINKLQKFTDRNALGIRLDRFGKF